MFENALTLRNVTAGRKITYKTLVSAGLGVQAVLAPVIMIGLRAMLIKDRYND